MASPVPTAVADATAAETALASPTTPQTDSPSRPPFLRLPPELLLRIIAYVARLGGPRDLAHLLQTSTTFYTLLSDSGQQNDNRIWRNAATALLGVCLPTKLTVEPTWQQFVKRTWSISKPNAKGKNHGDVVRELSEDEVLHSSHGGPFPPPTPLVGDYEAEFNEFAENLQWTEMAMPPVPEGATRIIDFVHSSTEAIRPETIGTTYSGANSGPFFTVMEADGPIWGGDAFDGSDMRLMKGYIVADNPNVKKDDGVLVTGGVQDLQNSWIKNLEEICDKVEVEDYMGWMRSCVHSDANLNLIPAVGSYGPNNRKIPIIAKIERYSSPNVIDKVWEFDTDLTSWSPGAREGDNDDMWQGPWGNESNWEFRSAGDYLAICDDNNGEKPSTVTCFKSGKRPLWQRKLVGTDENGRNFFWDNDGVRMSSAFVVYASRSKKTIGLEDPRRDSSGRNAMEFILISTETGEILRVLNMPQEDRPPTIEHRWNLCMWCSFSITDTMLIATVGGKAPRSERYQYPEALVWDLTVSSRTSPTRSIRLPKTWDEAGETYIATSPDGRYLGVQVDWDLGVWDLMTRTQVGVWRIARFKRYKDQWDLGDRVTGWNGIWVKYRDVFEVPRAVEKSPSAHPDDQLSPPSPAPSHTPPNDEKEQPREKHGVAYITTRTLHRIAVLHDDLRQMDPESRQKQLEDYNFDTDSILSDYDDDSDENGSEVSFDEPSLYGEYAEYAEFDELGSEYSPPYYDDDDDYDDDDLELMNALAAATERREGTENGGAGGAGPSGAAGAAGPSGATETSEAAPGHAPNTDFVAGILDDDAPGWTTDDMMGSPIPYEVRTPEEYYDQWDYI